MTILQDIATTVDVAKLQAENAALKAQLASKETAVRFVIRSLNETFKTPTGTESGKGTIAVYGLNKQFPVSLYPAQWEKLAKVLPSILVVINANRGVGNKAGLAWK